MSSNVSRALIVVVTLASTGCALLGRFQHFPPVEGPHPAVGDRWVYDVVNGYNGALIRKQTLEVVAATPGKTEVQVTDEPGGTYTRSYAPGWNPYSGEMAPGLPAGFGYDKTIPYGAPVNYAPALPEFRFPLVPGEDWKDTVLVTDRASGKQVKADVWAWVSGSERVSVPAGEFAAIKVSHDIYYRDWDWWRTQTRMELTDWYAPAVGNIVRREIQPSYYDYTRGRWNAPELVLGDYLIYRLAEYARASSGNGQ
jgi:hypothetical protein